jgi:hypothetical protein
MTSLHPANRRLRALSKRLSEVWPSLSTTNQSRIATNQAITAHIPDLLVSSYSCNEIFQDLPVELALPANLYLYPVRDIVEAPASVRTEKSADLAGAVLCAVCSACLGEGTACCKGCGGTDGEGCEGYGEEDKAKHNE